VEQENPENQPTPEHCTGSHARNGITACILFIGFLGLYHLNGGYLPGRDATGNVYLPVSVLRQGNLSFTPDEMPFMFSWELESDAGRQVVSFHSWDQKARDGRTFGELRDAGKLRVLEGGYFLIESVDPESRGYTNTFGPGAGLTALPFSAAWSMWTGRVADDPVTIWYGGKFVASFCVALSVVAVFGTLLPLIGRRPALLIAVAYGAGTCVWSLSSQTLWQSTPALMFLALAAFCLVRVRLNAWWAAACGLFAACAVICRPTEAVMVVAIGAYLAIVAWQQWRDRSRPRPLAKAALPLLLYVLAGLPLAVWLGYYNWHYLGSPLAFGQAEAGKHLAELKTGTPNPWQGSLPVGFCGLMASPSRGMAVYSPILLLAFWGAVRLWRQPGLSALRPVSITAAVLLLISSCWYDWYGGWSFGYRLVVDLVPLWAICGAGVVGVIQKSKPLLALFAVLLVWSVGVQVIGAYAYNGVQWNCRPAYLIASANEGKPRLTLDADVAKHAARQQGAKIKVVYLDVDRKANRHRLWSLRDNQLLYYVTHFAEARQMKKRIVSRSLQPAVIFRHPQPAAPADR